MQEWVEKFKEARETRDIRNIRTIIKTTYYDKEKN